MSDLLIRTKLHRPRVSSRVITRPRLLAQLHEQPERRLTLVIAPAGFGKTTIVAQWLAQSTAPCAWLSLDEDDSNLARCWRYLVAAVQQVFPASCAETAALLEAQQLPPLRYLADVLANDLAELPAPIVLVLDDYHQVSGQEVHEALARLVAHMPEQVQLVVISRTTVPWSLGRLRGLGQLSELRAAELRFSTAEARELLRASLAAEPIDEVAELLCARTEGWAVGLQLACLSLRAAPDARALAQGLRGTSRYIADYLLDEVLVRQPAALQRALLVSALPERFCAELCAELLEGELGTARALIAAIEAQGLFLVALDDQGDWYRYHHLVRDLLLFRLGEAVGEAGVVGLHRRCSTWFAGRGLMEEAVRHALSARDEALAARLVEESYCELLERDEGLVRLAPLLALLPEAAAAGRPRLLLARAFDSFIRLDFSAIIGGLAASLAEAGLARADVGGVDLRGDIALLQGIGSFWAGNFTRAVELLDEAYERIPQARATTHALAAIHLGILRHHCGDSAGAIVFLSDYIRQVGVAGSTARASFLWAFGNIYLLSGQIAQLPPMVRQLSADGPGGGRFAQCWGHYLLGRYHYERDELTAAEGCFVRASSFPYNAQERVHFDSLLSLAQIALVRGDLDLAAEYGQRARAFAEERASAGPLEVTTGFEAVLALAQGDQLAAVRRAQRIDPAPYTGLALWLAQARWCRAAVQVAQATAASLAEATTNLVRYLAEAEGANNLYWQIRAGGLLALAHDAQGESEQALATLARVVALAAPGGFVRSLVDCGPPLAELLRRLAPEQASAAYVARLLAAFPQGQELERVVAERPPASAPRAAPAATPALTPALLTEREQGILALLAERLTDQEIAERLTISITTVRTHTRNIYAKLEVENRREAIERARALGLLAGTARGA